MHLCHIFCNIKQRIHGDDKSHKLIKIVHVCGRWMVEMEYSFYESLSPLFGYHEGMAILLYISFFFFFLFFWGHASWACHLFF